ncbi:hypothetical protein SJR52_15350, partial [Aeromonas caviae]|uniref:hypothetical protein n=1 Tax=Aeromonas caviae TaxID=648 RepID=UPI0029D5C8BE
MKKYFAVIAIMTVSINSYAKEIYRAPSPGDSGTYYVLSREKIENGMIKVITSRVGKGNEYTDFTEMKINCASKQYFELAGSSE